MPGLVLELPGFLGAYEWDPLFWSFDGAGVAFCCWSWVFCDFRASELLEGIGIVADFERFHFTSLGFAFTNLNALDLLDNMASREVAGYGSL